LRYRDLLQVEDLFRRTEAIMRTRPIYHSSDAAIRGRIRHRGADWPVRTDAAPAVAALFRAAHTGLPPRARHARPPPAQSKPARNRRGRPGVVPRRAQSTTCKIQVFKSGLGAT
jgi:hypothetical protein